MKYFIMKPQLTFHKGSNQVLKKGAVAIHFDDLRQPLCLAPQTVIPLTGEMSRSDKRVIARYEQLEPVDGVTVQ